LEEIGEFSDVTELSSKDSLLSMMLLQEKRPISTSKNFFLALDEKEKERANKLYFEKKYRLDLNNNL